MPTVFNGKGLLRFHSKSSMQKTCFPQAPCFSFFIFCGYTTRVSLWRVHLCSGTWFTLKIEGCTVIHRSQKVWNLRMEPHPQYSLLSMITTFLWGKNEKFFQHWYSYFGCIFSASSSKSWRRFYSSKYCLDCWWKSKAWFGMLRG